MPVHQAGGIRKLSVSFVLLRCGFAGTVMAAPGVAAIGELPFAASNQPDAVAPRRTRMRPVTFGTALLPQPARPCVIVARTTVGLCSTSLTDALVVWMLCVTSRLEIASRGRFAATTSTSAVAVPHGPGGVKREGEGVRDGVFGGPSV